MESATMAFQIDGQTKELELKEEIPFEQVIEAIKGDLNDPEFSITRIKLNGEDITGKSWERFSHFTLKDIKDLQVETGNIERLARETLSSLKDFTGNVIEELKRAAEQFRLGQFDQGGEVFSHTLDGIQLVNHISIMVERNLEIESRYQPNNGQTLAIQMTNLKPVIEDIFAAQKDQDWILLADLIDYELVPHFNDRLNMFRGWEERTSA